MDADRVVGQARRAVALASTSLPSMRADGAVDVADRQRRARPASPLLDAPAAPARSARGRAPCRGRGPASTRSAARDVRPAASAGSRIVREVEAARLPVRRCAVRHVEAGRRGRSSRRCVRKPSSAISSRTSSAMKRKKLIDVLGLAGELLAQLRILRGDADRAGVEVAVAHHDAARRRPAARWRSRTPRRRAARRSRRRGRSSAGRRPGRRCGRAGRSARSTCCVSARPSSQGMPACLIDGQRRGAGAAVVAGDQDHVGVRLGDAGGDRADADLGHQLHADARLGVGVLQVVDELREVLDRVDVVVRRRRDQRRRRASSGAPWRSTGRPCGRAAGRPRRAWRPGPS